MPEALDTLTDKEKETLRLMVRGHDAKSAARELDLSVHTINERLRAARRKLEVTSSREAARVLFESEGGTPENLAHETLGDAEPRDGADQSRTGQFRPLLIGGLIVMSLTLIAILLSATDPTVQPSNGLQGGGARSEQAAQSAGTIPDPSPVELDGLQTVALEWLYLIDARDWEAAYNSSAMQDQIDQAQLEAALKGTVMPLGPVKSRKFKEFGSVRTAGVDYRLVLFTTDFANRSGVVETVTLTEKDGEYRVGGYWLK